MTSPLNAKRRWATLGLVVFALGGLGLAAEHAPALALVNESPSLPKGVYVRRPAARPTPGAVVAVRQPNVARAYLGELGMPAPVLLIKRVAAVEGDPVCRRGFGLQTPERVVTAHLVDRRGRALPQWRDCRRLRAGEFFLLGDTADSFDSRYFGPVRAGEIKGVYQAVVSW
ncbi:MAG: S26 family signal peptidase [Brevundimonas sp.]